MSKSYMPLAAACLAALAAARADDVASSWQNSVTGTLAVLDRIHARPGEAALDESLALAVLRAADPGARIVTDAELDHLRQERNGFDFATGARLSTSNGLPVLVDVPTNSPAAAAGLRRDDLLTSIRGRDAQDLGICRASLLLRSHETGNVHVAYWRRSGETNEVDVALELRQMDDIETAERLGSDAAYLRLNGLYTGTAQRVLAEVTNWQARGVFGLVLDLRGADGQDARAAAQIAGRFEQQGHRLYTFRDRRDQDLEVVKADSASPCEMPVMVLVDGETTGAAELLAATFAGSVRGAMLIGYPTSGDPLLREAIPLGDGRHAWVAARRLVTADGHVLDGRTPLPPDVALAPDEGAAVEDEYASPLDRRGTLDEEAEDRALRSRFQGDAALRRAVDILQSLKALNIRAFRASAPDRD